MPTPAPRKPAGGITAAALTPAGNLLRAAAADGRIEATFRDPDALTAFPLAEQRSSYTELLDTQAGPQRVRHELTLVISREAADALLTPAFRRTAAAGVVAVVTMASGEQLLAGWSPHLGTQQPLRLASVGMESGTKPLDGTPVAVTFTSEDADRAAPLKPQEP